MYKLCKTRESANRQRQVERGLLAAMKQQPFQSVSVSDLCSRLQIPRKTFYRYFDNKEDCLYGLIDHTIMDYGTFATSAQGSGQTLEGELHMFFQFWQENAPLLDALKLSALEAVLVERAIGFVLSDGILSGEYLHSDARELRQHVMIFGTCGILTMMLGWHREGFQRSARELARIAARILTRPLFSPEQNEG